MSNHDVTIAREVLKLIERMDRAERRLSYIGETLEDQNNIDESKAKLIRIIEESEAQE